MTHDPDTDVARTEPVVTNRGDGQRVWATGWYRIKPGTFVHHELFFDPEQIVCVYADQSYKSFLLRRSGRAREAARVGRSNLDKSPEDMLKHERSFTLPIETVQRFRLKPGSLLFKPRLVIETDERDYEFYHKRRGQNVAALAATLRDQYEIVIEEE